jgi:hypothetical protein
LNRALALGAPIVAVTIMAEIAPATIFLVLRVRRCIVDLLVGLSRSNYGSAWGPRIGHLPN